MINKFSKLILTILITEHFDSKQSKHVKEIIAFLLGLQSSPDAAKAIVNKLAESEYRSALIHLQTATKTASFDNSIESIKEAKNNLTNALGKVDTISNKAIFSFFLGISWLCLNEKSLAMEYLQVSYNQSIDVVSKLMLFTSVYYNKKSSLFVGLNSSRVADFSMKSFLVAGTGFIALTTLGPMAPVALLTFGLWGGTAALSVREWSKANHVVNKLNLETVVNILQILRNIRYHAEDMNASSSSIIANVPMLVGIREVYIDRTVAWFSEIQKSPLEGSWSLEGGYTEGKPNDEAISNANKVNWEKY